MTFSAKVKAELCKCPIANEETALAEICGIVLFANTFDSRSLRITTENQDFAARVSKIIKMLFGYDFDRKIIPASTVKKYSFTIDNPDKLSAIYNAFGYDRMTTHTLHLNGALVEDDATRAAFVRGAFLAGGSVTDPDREYHMELVTSHHQLSREVMALLYELDTPAKLTVRKSNQVIYFKESTYIEELLTRIGAPVCAMQLMETKMFKELRNSINRKVNCETANLSKVVNAASEQCDAIRVIDEIIGLESLPPKLFEAAKLRRENEEMPLSELAAMLGISKSGLNHRFKKIIETAKELKEKSTEKRGD